MLGIPPPLLVFADALSSGPATEASVPAAATRATSPRNSRRVRCRSACAWTSATRSRASLVDIRFRSANQAMRTVRETWWHSGLRDIPTSPLLSRRDVSPVLCGVTKNNTTSARAHHGTGAMASVVQRRNPLLVGPGDIAVARCQEQDCHVLKRPPSVRLVSFEDEQVARFDQNLVGPSSTDRGEQRAPGEQIEHFVAAAMAFPVMIGAAGSNADHPEHGGTVAGIVSEHVRRRQPDSCQAGGDADLPHSSAPRKSVSRSSFGATPFFCSRMPALPR